MQSGRALSSRWLRNALSVERNLPALQLPVFLCPAAAHGLPATAGGGGRGQPQARQVRRLHAGREAPAPADHAPVQAPARALPLQCSGCGALAQTTQPEVAGYYDTERRAIRRYLGLEAEERRPREEDRILAEALRRLEPSKLGQLALDVDTLLPRDPAAAPGETAEDASPPPPPLCDRCHSLVHHNSAKPIYHPSIDSLRETVEESPYKYNHVYHVLDAADFPMSLLPRVHSLLDLMPLRSQNRRAKHGRFYGDKKTELSFIITRSDLLAPRKEQVDSLMPYLKETLRDALGRTARNVRLGNVRCVSAKRSWWTGELREDIWKRGGAGWLVGKANVGKSQLFEAVFPKGRMDWEPPKQPISVPVFPRQMEPPGPVNLVAGPAPAGEQAGEPLEPAREEKDDDDDDDDEVSMLPPAQPESNYPAMPVVSPLPGTTASPIRVPFGNGRGELIDLPGMARSDLELYVQEEHRPELVMKARVTPEQQALRPGQSLLLGGLIRITPRTPDLTFLSYAFTPIRAHRTATDKAAKIQEQTGEVQVENIAVPGTGDKIKHAGAFELKWDVTKRRAGPLTSHDAVKLKVEQLPFRVLATDILIEGCGWVEIVAQVRARDLYAPRNKEPEAPEAPEAPQEGGLLQTLDLLSDPGEDQRRRLRRRPAAEAEHDAAAADEPNWPVVDVYSPEGRFVAARRPMNAWVMNRPRKTAKTTRSRPRKSMKGAKKGEKRERRAAAPGEASF